MTGTAKNGLLEKGNREVITDFYAPNDVVDQKNAFRFKVFIRLNAKKSLSEMFPFFTVSSIAAI